MSETDPQQSRTHSESAAETASEEPPAKVARKGKAEDETLLSRRAQKKAERKERRKERRQQRHKERVAHVAETGVVPATALSETSYCLRGDGLRRVRPYAFTFSVPAKLRWVGRDVVEVFSAEFGLPSEFYERQLARGLLRVSDGCDDDGDCQTRRRVISQGDIVSNTVHRHEPPVTAQPVTVLAETEDLVVVDKPASLPVHPCGAFRHNSVAFVMAAESGLNGLHSVHRLDRMTSGVLLLARSTEAAARYMRDIQQGTAHKTYLARVVGRFEGETTVDQPIEMSQNLGRGFMNHVGPKGKPSVTVFRALRYDAETDTTVVECRPLTGRTHQIRIHLAWLGHPIANDPLYNPVLFAKHKPVWGTFDDEASGSDGGVPLPPPPSAETAAAIEGPAPVAPSEGQEALTSSPDVSDGCPWCAREWPDPTPADLVMWLHAHVYEGPGWRYVAPAPAWALLDASYQP